jgi:hypothetical protein
MSDGVFPKGQDGRRYFWMDHAPDCPALRVFSSISVCECDVHLRHGPKEQFDTTPPNDKGPPG